MSRCFVIQPFDGGVFDARYEDLIAPAVVAAGLEPYRVDRDPTVSIPINDIEIGIRDASVCLADISLDNPNVWFELGYAISAHKEVVLVCSDARTTKFPFDVQHRSIIKYQTGAPRDFLALSNSVTERLKAIVSKENTINKVVDITASRRIHGLDQFEIVALAAICENLVDTEDVIASWQIKRDMERAGFTGVATTISLRKLLSASLISVGDGYDGRSEYKGYVLTDAGWEWVLSNKDQFQLKADIKASVEPKRGGYDLEDDIPF